MTTNDEPIAILKVDGPISPEQSRRISEMFSDPPHARLRAMTLPNGRYILVLDGVPDGDTEWEGLAGEAGAAAVLQFPYRVDVQSWPDAELSVAAAEACAMTHGEDDAALIGAVRGMYAAQAAEAESWRLSGAEAVERVGVLEAEAFRLRAILDEVGAMAADNRHLPVCSQIYDAASRVGRAA